MINEEDELSVRIPFLIGNNFPIQGTKALYANLNVTPIAHTIWVMATGFP